MTLLKINRVRAVETEMRFRQLFARHLEKLQSVALFGLGLQFELAPKFQISLCLPSVGGRPLLEHVHATALAAFRGSSSPIFQSFGSGSDCSRILSSSVGVTSTITDGK